MTKPKEPKRVNEEELKSFFEQQYYGHRGKLWIKENRAQLDSEWAHAMTLFDPPSMYEKNEDGSFTRIDTDE